MSLKFFCLRLAYSRKKLEEVLPERLPVGMVKEFDESMRDALLVRHSFLDLRDNFRRIIDPPLQSSNNRGALFSYCLFEIYDVYLCIFIISA